MKLRHIILGAISIYGVFVMVACGNKNSSNDPVTTYTCPAGTAYYNSGNCYNQNGQIIGSYGPAAAVNQDSGYLAETMRNQNLTVTNTAVFKSFLQKAFGVCDRASINGGTASCDAWVGSYFMVGLQSIANQNLIKLTFYTDYRANPYFNYSYQLPTLNELFAGLIGFPTFNDNTGAYLPWFQVDAVTSLINASKGFESRAYGPLPSAANRSLIQVQVDNGKILDNPLNFKLSFEGQVMATGRFYRCNNANCQ